MRFLADESCDFAVVTALRAAGHDVTAVVEISPRATDPVVLALARSEARILLTEDKDVGMLAYAGGHQAPGVVLIRVPNDARRGLGEAMSSVVAELGEVIKGAFVVLEPGRARVSRPPALE